MAKKESNKSSAGSNAREPTEEELAACALVVELLRSGRIITYISDILVERVDELDFPGESEEAVVIRRFCELVAPQLVEDLPAEPLWQAAGLIESIRDQIVTDFQRKLEDGKRRS